MFKTFESDPIQKMRIELGREALEALAVQIREGMSEEDAMIFAESALAFIDFAEEWNLTPREKRISTFVGDDVFEKDYFWDGDIVSNVDINENIVSFAFSNWLSEDFEMETDDDIEFFDYVTIVPSIISQCLSNNLLA